MRAVCRILAAGCLCLSMAGTLTVYADVEGSPHVVSTVRATGDYSNIAVSQVTDYVNVREQATTRSGVAGKIYNQCAATILETVQGEGGAWYRIQSGSVTGYVKAQYFLVGQEAEKLAQSIGREFVTVNTEGLRLREKPDLGSQVLTHLSNGARYVVQGEEGEFFKVEVDADMTGYIAKQFCKTEVEFDQAVSLEEERLKVAEEAQRKQEADNAMAALAQAKQEAAAGASGELIIAANPQESSQSVSASAPQLYADGSKAVAASPVPGAASPFPGGPGSGAVTSATRTAIVAYARQFLGNPYVYGGTSLTNGADCSGFTQGVYANFGITVGRSSRDQAANGREIAVSAAQPGDLLFYASGNYINHVAMYIGDGKVIHASTPTTGITISPYDYRTPCKAVTFLD
ncbi:MAG: C40 family peptidase [Lachnospiraceae bacterium]|nr:C40 family peptidase [Lachnospiraceae bacterium]